jgi:predicted Zn-dependent peptidase
MSSRLFQNIRERRGLVYSIYSSLNLYRDAGTLVVYAGMGRRNAAGVVELTCRELRALKNRLVPAAELERAKENLRGSIVLSLESSSSRMTHLAQQEIYDEQFVDLDEVLRNVERVRARDVRRLANEIFDTRFLTLTSLGSGSGDGLGSVALSV